MTFSDLLKEPSLQIPIYVLITILGVMFGSFLNVLIYRIPKKEEFVKFKVLDEKDGYFLVDLGEVWIKEKTQ